MTDLEKFKSLFDDIGIRYTMTNYDAVNKIEIDIHPEMVFQSYDNSVHITFDDNGMFKNFEGWGE